jgi:hypothetical protein
VSATEKGVWRGTGEAGGSVAAAPASGEEIWEMERKGHARCAWKWRELIAVRENCHLGKIISFELSLDIETIFICSTL